MILSSSPRGIRVFAEDFRLPERVLCLRQAVRTRADNDARSAINVRLSYQPSLLAQSIRGPDIAISAFPNARERNCSMLGLSDDFLEMGTAAKIRDHARSEQPTESIKQFLDSGVTVNVLRQVTDSLDSVASGVACYIAFCDFIGAEYVPPTAYRLRQRSALFRPCKAFGLYVSHVRKACQILNSPISWGDSLLKGAIKGLAHAQDKSHELPNIADVVSLGGIIDFEGLESQFPLLAFSHFYTCYGRPQRACV